MPHTGDKCLFKRSIVGPFRESFVDCRVMDSRLSVGCPWDRQALPLHACVEHPQNEVEDAMIAEFTLRPPPGHRQVRKDKCGELWLGELNGNRRRRWTFGHIAHRKWFVDKHEHLTSESLIVSYNTMGCRMDETRNHLKWIKQHLRIKRFYGTSENAVKTQIWIAVSVYVLVAIVRKRLRLEAPLYTLLQVFSVAVFEKIEIQTAFSREADGFEVAHDDNQLNFPGFKPDSSVVEHEVGPRPLRRQLPEQGREYRLVGNGRVTQMRPNRAGRVDRLDRPIRGGEERAHPIREDFVLGAFRTPFPVGRG